MIVTPSLVEQISHICCACEEAKLQAYRSRPGNPNRIEFVAFGEARAMRFPDVAFFNRVYGFNESLIDQLPAIIQFYQETNTAFELWMSPDQATESLCRKLAQRGFIPWGYHTKFYADLSELNVAACDSRVDVVRVEPSQLEEFLGVLLTGWGFSKEHHEGAKINMRLRLTIPGMHLFIGRLDGRSIAGAVLYQKGEVAYLAEAATAVGDRQRGGQLKLMEARIQVARVLGCRLVVGCAHFGNSSFRNMQRIGLKMAFSDMGWHYPAALPTLSGES